MLQILTYWNPEKLGLVIPFHNHQILKIRPSICGALEELVWLKSSTGDYSTRSGYGEAAEAPLKKVWTLWQTWTRQTWTRMPISGISKQQKKSRYSYGTPYMVPFEKEHSLLLEAYQYLTCAWDVMRWNPYPMSVLIFLLPRRSGKGHLLRLNWTRISSQAPTRDWKRSEWSVSTTIRYWTWNALVVDHLEPMDSEESTHLPEERGPARRNNCKCYHWSSWMDSDPRTFNKTTSTTT